jgi:hypothetical protein
MKVEIYRSGAIVNIKNHRPTSGYILVTPGQPDSAYDLENEYVNIHDLHMVLTRSNLVELRRIITEALVVYDNQDYKERD